MCLTLPGKVLSVENGIAEVEENSKIAKVDLGLVDGAKAGDWILYASKRAVKIISDNDAKEIIELLADNYRPVDEKRLPKKFRHLIFELRKNFEKKSKKSLSTEELAYLLNTKNADACETLYGEANSLRKITLPDFVCIHGIIEFSNYCKNSCLYCGIGHGAKIERYRMKPEEIVETAKSAVENEGYKLLVLQSGEDDFYSDDDLIEIISVIKKKMRVFVFISVGERSKKFYQRAFDAGASGSLFRFETSNKKLYKILHPGHNLKTRIENLENQIKIGYYVASGGLIGVPGQTTLDLANDLLLIKKLRIPMLSSGPYISSGNSPLGISNFQFPISKHNFVDNNETMKQCSNEVKLRLTLNYYALARLMMPEIKIPVTTALETLDPENGRHKGLLAGANALMFNLTPKKYCKKYSIYDNKYREREKVWQKYGLFKGEESYEMLEKRLKI